MIFFHVYNDDCFTGLEKNGLINKDTGFKIQHCFAVPKHRLFNDYAAKGTKLHSLIKSENIPFYVDRIAGGINWYPYKFDKELICEYCEILGDRFLGFQLHESGSNLRVDWSHVRRIGQGDGPYDPELLEKALINIHKTTPDGRHLSLLTQENVDYFANRKYAASHEDYLAELREIFKRRMDDTDGNIIPCDSYYLAAKLQNEVGMRTFMPEVGSQIPLMCAAVALARGMARAEGKAFGTYYECWRKTPGYGYTMPCFNTDPVNEWYLTQETHEDDFTTHGHNGGSSRLLQNRIYYYSLMAGAHYMAEEWGLNCSYNDMNTFELSEYGIVKKNFINNALRFRGIEAKIPFALVIPKRYACYEINRKILDSPIGENRGVYMDSPLNEADAEYFGHIEDLTKLFFAYYERTEGDNEDHVITNTRFGDVVDIIYEDASDEALARYDYLIDASPDGAFAAAKAEEGFKILESGDVTALASRIPDLIKETMPCFADALHWLVSTDENGKRYLSIFNNSGNERDIKRGDIIHREADRTVTVTFKDETVPEKLVEGDVAPVSIMRIDEKTYKILVPAASFAIFTF
ncbi:MAG: hypothetical protein E7665_07565 [Ruminococcaceae bacterium]|nr:hypothetical protein [Oscillospiraceae bacterium]